MLSVILYNCKCKQMSQRQPIKKRDALQRMRDLSEQDIPFSIGFVKCNVTSKVSGGYKVVDKAILRKGYRANQSDKAEILIYYIDFNSNNGKEANRHFYLPLLMMFNGLKVIP